MIIEPQDPNDFRANGASESLSDIERLMKIGTDGSARIFFVGIGGISMSGLAELSLRYGYTVGGSDMHESHRTKVLAQEGVVVFVGHDAKNIRTFNPDLVVYTAAVLPGNPEIQFARDKGIPAVSRAEYLGHFTRRFGSVVNISGTHGKTTTTSMLSMILIESGRDPTVHLGAEFEPFCGTVRSGSDRALLVSEACEYRRSFLSFRSTTAAITNIDFDHVDCFKNIAEIIDVFAEFTDQLDDPGFLVIPAFDANVSQCYESIRKRRADAARPLPSVLTTGLEGDVFPPTGRHADFFAKNIVYHDGYPSFDVWNGDDLYAHIELRVPGKHNLYNALTAIACASVNGGTQEGAVRALNAFRGAEGRFTFKGKYRGATVITDYAHHPAAARATLQAASEVPHKKTWVVFQPLTFNRTEILFDDYVSSLLPCEHVIFAEIFSDREINPGTVSSSMLADAINRKGGHAEFFTDKRSILDRLDELVGPDDLVLFLGPEDIRDLSDELNFD